MSNMYYRCRKYTAKVLLPIRIAGYSFKRWIQFSWIWPPPWVYIEWWQRKLQSYRTDRLNALSDQEVFHLMDEVRKYCAKHKNWRDLLP